MEKGMVRLLKMLDRHKWEEWRTKPIGGIYLKGRHETTFYGRPLYYDGIEFLWSICQLEGRDESLKYYSPPDVQSLASALSISEREAWSAVIASTCRFDLLLPLSRSPEPILAIGVEETILKTYLAEEKVKVIQGLRCLLVSVLLLKYQMFRR